MPTVASLFAGAGLLDLGFEEQGFDLLWHAENDRYASLTLAERWPAVPNHGDVTKIDWHSLDPPDVLIGGPPCQPVSQAGSKRGMEDERWLWPAYLEALGVLRPRWAVMENPPGIAPYVGWLTSRLASRGYVGSWRRLRASDLGGCHARDRYFFVAAHADHPARRDGDDGHTLAARIGNARLAYDDRGAATHAGRVATERRRELRDMGGPTTTGARYPQQLERYGHPPSDRGEDAADTEREGREGRLVGHGRCGPPVDGRQADADTDRVGLERQPAGNGPHPGVDVESGLGDAHRRGDDAPHPDSPRLARPQPAGRRNVSPWCGWADDSVDWGIYEAGVRRWEYINGCAPRPTNPVGRLNPFFVEWMMGAPIGWTDVAGVSRTQRLKQLGNAVFVPAARAVADFVLSLS